jgi:uncharacterized protein (UPF0212 family)
MTDLDEDFKARVKLTFETGLKLKLRMKERGLTVAQTKCPKCGNRLDAALVGRKAHLHMACRTSGCLQMME